LSEKKTVTVPFPNRPCQKLAEVPKTEADPRFGIAISSGAVLFRDVLSSLLDKDPAFKILGQANNEKDLIRLMRRDKPRVLLFDYEALGPGGESVISRLRRAVPETRILVMASRTDSEHVGRVLRAGASGLVGKNLTFETLMRAIHAVGRGEVWADRRATARVLEDLTIRQPRVEDRLTRREVQIVEAVARGLRNKEIASQLRISQKTVKSHLNNIFRKLRVDGRVALAIFAQERGDQQRS
jgi:two-component system nitrate/nitrite response regulator NarL